VRRSEKKVLKEVHKMIKDKLDGPPSKMTIQMPTEKAFVLLIGGQTQTGFVGSICFRDTVLHGPVVSSRFPSASDSLGTLQQVT